jgi:hypothetical protein
VLRAALSCDKFGRVKLPDSVRREAMVKLFSEPAKQRLSNC